MVVRAAAGAAVAAAVSIAARRAGALSESGRWAALATGVLAAAAGWWWAGTLIAFFVTSSALTRWRAGERAMRTEGILPRTTERSARQVLANGGVCVLCALAWRFLASDRFAFAALGAVAAASADTWSTEIGTLLGGTPWLITTGRRVQAGMSGGVSAAGFAAGIAGALFVALLGAYVLPQHHWRLVGAAAAGGCAGCLADSLLGATLQSGRFCDRCGSRTEAPVHSCGYRTRRARGINWMSNDAVNFFGTMAGALVASLAGGTLSR